MIWTPALANAGVPMLAIFWIGALFLLIPIIGIEGVVLRHMTHLPWRRALGLSTAANLISTVAGIPLVWGVFFLIEALAPGSGSQGVWNAIRTAAWIPPTTDEEYAWRTPLAGLILCGP